MNDSHKSLIVVLTCVLIFVALVSPVYAILPPRPDVTPVPEDSPVGTIILEVSPPRTGLWSVVQWQDAGGGWHDVEGWRGAVKDGLVIWWVEEKQWGTGPYQWAVYQQQGGQLLAVSKPFFLPGSGDKLIVKVDLLG